MAEIHRKEVLILKHVANEGAGTILHFLEEKGIPYRFIELYAGEKLPASLENVRAVCVMGGPMNVYEEGKHPFLKDEDVFLKKVLSSGVPCLGVCLGSQLIAKTLGGRVYKAAAPEIGWANVRLTAEAANDPMFAAAPFPDFQVLQWHEDTFDLPAGATLLASSESVPHQAFRLGERVYGLQFHVEVDRPMVEDWFKKSADREKIVSRFEDYQTELLGITRKFYAYFFAG